MDPKINYLRSQISGVNSQLAADNGKSTILQLLGKAKALLNAREELTEPVNRANTEALLTQVVAAVTAYNAANQITVDSVADIMAGFDAAVVPADEPVDDAAIVE
jgi:type VI protein secretion system component VasF